MGKERCKVVSEERRRVRQLKTRNHKQIDTEPKTRNDKRIDTKPKTRNDKPLHTKPKTRNDKQLDTELETLRDTARLQTQFLDLVRKFSGDVMKQIGNGIVKRYLRELRRD